MAKATITILADIGDEDPEEVARVVAEHELTYSHVLQVGMAVAGENGQPGRLIAIYNQEGRQA